MEVQIDETTEAEEVYVPFGQRVINSRFKRITREEIRERFACGKISTELKETAWKQARKYCEDETIEYEKMNRYLKFWTPKPRAMKGRASIPYTEICRLKEATLFSDLFPQFKKEHKIFYFKVCDVKYVELEHYIEEKIPERCLQSIAEARKLGMEKFKVAYPIVEDTRLKDPIIVGYVDHDMFEIDMFE